MQAPQDQSSHSGGALDGRGMSPRCTRRGIAWGLTIPIVVRRREGQGGRPFKSCEVRENGSEE